MAEQVVIIDDVVRMFNALERRAGDLRIPFRQLRRDMDEDLRTHFADRRGPDGAWADWSASTVEKFVGKRDGRGRRANVYNRGERKGQVNARGAKRRANLLGRLKSAWDFAVQRVALVATSRVPWSGVHQEGGTAGRGARIPARPFMWVSPAFVEQAKKTLLGYITRGNW